MPKDKTPVAEPTKAVSFVNKRPKQKDPGPEVNMPCQRGKNIATKGSSCDGKRAFNMSPAPGARTASFKCCKCGYEWNVPMGGTFSGV